MTGCTYVGKGEIETGGEGEGKYNDKRGWENGGEGEKKCKDRGIIGDRYNDTRANIILVVVVDHRPTLSSAPAGQNSPS